VIQAKGNAPTRPYVQSVTWDGKPYTRSWFSHAQIAKGGTIVFEMGAQPNEKFGAAATDRPPSFA
jgi:putative alpha-1,2-mannosidase